MAVSDTAEALLEALPYICQYIGKTIVVKVGGSVGAEGTVLEDIAWLARLGVKPVIVHGGGPQITAMLTRLGVETHFVQGRRYTDEQALKVAHMVLMELNGQFVSYLSALGVSAFGVNGLDGGLLQAHVRDETLGRVGEVDAVTLKPLTMLAERGYVVVLAPLATGPGGRPLNVNADTVAGEVARALAAEKLVLFTDVPGVMNEDGAVLPQLSREEVDALMARGIIRGGMIPKIEACLRALDTVPRVHVLDGRTPRALLRELFTGHGAGTTLTNVGSS